MQRRFADTDPAITSGDGDPSTVSNISTVLIKSKDKALALSASSALSELDGYRLIFCEDDNSAKSRLDEVNVDLILYDFDEDDFEPDNALVRSRLSHTACWRIVVCKINELSRTDVY